MSDVAAAVASPQPNVLSPLLLPPPPTSNGRRVVVAIEGNIGIGKSTLLRNLREHYASSPFVAFVDEPVELWEAHNLLEAMYTDRISRCCFQLMALTTRYTSLFRVLEERPEATLIITERSIFSDRYCFAAVNLSTAPDKACYDATHDALIASLPNSDADGCDLGTVLLEAPRATLNERIAKRGRAQEQEQRKADGAVGDGDGAGGDAEAEAVGGVPDAYLAKLDDAHADYYDDHCSHPAAKARIDATRSPAEVARAVIGAIDGFVAHYRHHRTAPAAAPSAPATIGKAAEVPAVASPVSVLDAVAL